jgi:hypothetical protein
VAEIIGASVVAVGMDTVAVGGLISCVGVAGVGGVSVGRTTNVLVTVIVGVFVTGAGVAVGGEH